MHSNSSSKRSRSSASAAPLRRGSERKRFLVVDDDEQVHHLFQLCFQEEYQLHFVFTAEEALSLVQSVDFPVVTLDLNLPGKSGIEILPELRQTNSFQKIIILTGYACKSSAITAINLGAFRYFEKPFALSEMKLAIEEGFELYHQERALALEKKSTPFELMNLGLTRREAEVAIRVIPGQTNLEIAADLGVSPRTIEKHLEIIFAKLKVTSRHKVGQRVKQLLRHKG